MDFGLTWKLKGFDGFSEVFLDVHGSVWIHSAVGEESVGDLRPSSAELLVESLGALPDAFRANRITEDPSAEFDEVINPNSIAERLIFRLCCGKPSILGAR